MARRYGNVLEPTRIQGQKILFDNNVPMLLSGLRHLAILA